MLTHPVPMLIRARRSAAPALLLAMIAVLGAVSNSPALADDGATAQVDVTRTEVGVVQPEPSVPQLPRRGLSPLVVATIVLMGAVITAAAGVAVVSRRRQRE